MAEHFATLIIDESTWCSLSEACSLCRVDDQRIQEMIREGFSRRPALPPRNGVLVPRS